MTCKSQGSNDERPKKNLPNFWESNKNSQNESIQNNNDTTHNCKPTTKEKDGNNMGNKNHNPKATDNSNSGNIHGKESDRFMSYIMAKIMNDRLDSPVQFCPNPKDTEKCHQCAFNPNNHEAEFSVRRIGSFEEFMDKLLNDDTNPAETPDEPTDSDKCESDERSENSELHIDYHYMIRDIDHRLNRLDRNVNLLINQMKTPAFEPEPMELMEGISCIDDVKYEIKHQMKRRLKPIDQRMDNLNEKMDILVRILSEMKDNIKGNSSCKCDSDKTEKK